MPGRIMGALPRQQVVLEADMPPWDVFISYASEDKDEVALPLSVALRRAGLRVWLDRQEIRVGDSLNDKINEGLANSRFGVVILSPAFLAKSFPRKELNGLSAIEDATGAQSIIPVWHRIDGTVLARHAPLLADRLAANTDDGIPTVTTQILDAVADTHTALSPLRLLGNLLGGDADGEAVGEFLAFHPDLMHRTLHSQPGTERWSVHLGPASVDLCASRTQYTTGEMTWFLVQFEPPGSPAMTGTGPAAGVERRVAELRDARRWIARNLRAARRALPRIDVGFSGFVVSGRRSLLDQGRATALREYNRELLGTTVRTYDWIVDAAAEDPE
ncbi:toll/interleukin-1 receptor domain-containing protein [Streptomyces sp. NPDC059467]|uniref:toll/interleukin-1 receptor domain-containing protein n=1 Tax=Streptomyces sp. NPDC059467 TaxID=3346844 RepID=UPI0036C54333